MELFNGGKAINAVNGASAVIAGNDESSTEKRRFGFPFTAITAMTAF
jgi:hypothetical protein